ncbi:RICIN domain-containing protein [Streptomyces sp. NPDC102274]|uniref:RICIN domain-containing protein n=1 Tax=Streptomyces sp. NPDC102274 TaxID=3366151 RepID=UPI003801ED80
MRRTSLPRPEVLAAFVRACGDGERLDAWLATREKIAAARVTTEPTPTLGQGTDTQPGTEDVAHERPRRFSGPRMIGSAATLAVTALALIIWLPSADTARPRAAPPTDGWVTIRPARTVDLCLTDGRDRKGAYGSAVAVQLPCVESPVPRTYLEPVGEGLFRIQWHHPQLGKGCLTIMGKDQIKGMLEPRQNCDQGTLFQMEPAAGAFRLRSSTSGRCIGIVGNDTTQGAEAIEERCSGAADQRFLLQAG